MQGPDTTVGWPKSSHNRAKVADQKMDYRPSFRLRALTSGSEVLLTLLHHHTNTKLPSTTMPKIKKEGPLSKSEF